MLLLVAATDDEMAALRERLPLEAGVEFLVCGMGPVEAAVRFCSFFAGDRKNLAAEKKDIEAVVNFGVAGAFLETGVSVLDICLAGKEILGDLGICFPDRVDSFDVPGLPFETEFPFDNQTLAHARSILDRNLISYHDGNFVTVNSVSGTAARGVFLRDSHQAMCENMEGAALARVCKEVGLPFLEIRCVSNLVEDRDVSAWKLNEAIERCAEVVVKIVSEWKKE